MVSHGTHLVRKNLWFMYLTALSNPVDARLESSLKFRGRGVKIGAGK